jgi:hypothetical protein
MLDEAIVFLAIQILLPLVPAYLLFQALPSTAAVSNRRRAVGPLSGLEIKLGGAFAGYLVLFGFIIFYGPRPPSKWQPFQVMGTLAFSDPSDPTPFNRIQILQRPTNIELDDAGGFTLDILVKPGANGSLTFPVLVTSLPGYGTVSVDLSANKPEVGTDYGVVQTNDRINISKPIVLSKLPKYAATHNNLAKETP